MTEGNKTFDELGVEESLVTDVDSSEEFRLRVIRGLLWLQIPVAAISNILLITVILLQRSLLTTTNVFWLSIAFASTLQQILGIVELATSLQFLGASCKIFQYMWFTSEFIISFLWVAIAFHTLLRMTKPKHDAIMKKFSPLVIGGICLLSSVIAVPAIPYSGESTVNICYVESQELFFFLSSILNLNEVKFPKYFEYTFYNFAFFVPFGFCIPVFILLFICTGIMLRLYFRSTFQVDFTAVRTVTDIKHICLYFLVWVLASAALFFSFDNGQLFAYVVPVLILATVGCTLYRSYHWQVKEGVDHAVLVLAIVGSIYWVPYLIIFIAYLSKVGTLGQFYLVSMCLPYLVLIFPFLILIIKHTCLTHNSVSNSESKDAKREILLISLHVLFNLPFYVTNIIIFGADHAVPSHKARWIFPLTGLVRGCIALVRLLSFCFLQEEVKSCINRLLKSVFLRLPCVKRYHRRPDPYNVSVSMSQGGEDNVIPEDS